jgi:hypothetical protein
MITAKRARELLIEANRRLIEEIDDAIVEAAGSSRSLTMKLDPSISEIVVNAIHVLFSTEPRYFTVTVDTCTDSRDEFLCYVLRISW